MRRKKDDKRVLVSPRDTRKSKSSRRQKRRVPQRNVRQSPKRNGVTVVLVILALIAFVIGAGIGISLSFDDGNDDGPRWINVTEEMTTNLNDTPHVYYDTELDDVDFNDNATLTELNVTTEPTY